MTFTLPTCPDLWSGSFAQDGLLLRMRIPGGILTVPQCEAIAQFATQLGGGYVQVTNRANLQIRELQTAIAPDTFRQFQELGLASRTISVDALRNVMASPTAGIDAQMLIDTRPLVTAWDEYLQVHPELAALSPKFSVGLDGGEAVSMGDRHNDIVLSAEKIMLSAERLSYGVNLFTADSAVLADLRPAAAFRLYLAVEGGVSDLGILIPPQHSIPVLAALARVYLDYSQSRQRPDGRKPRLRHAIAEWGMAGYLDRVQRYLPDSVVFSLLSEAIATADHPRPRLNQDGNRVAAAHLGIYPQRQPGLSYVGVALPLGRLEALQLRSLAALTQTIGSGTLRLTPWQTLILPDIPTAHLPSVQTQLAALGFHWSALRPDSALVACSGSRGCVSAATDTHAQALALVTHLQQCLAEQSLTLTQPLNIHISGCEKSCAQHTPLDVALVGQSIFAVGSGGDLSEETYDLYVGAAAMPFGRRVFRAVNAAAVPMLLEQMIRVYQRQQQPQESFGNFCDRHSIAQLQQWFKPQMSENRAIRVTS